MEERSFARVHNFGLHPRLHGSNRRLARGHKSGCSSYTSSLGDTADLEYGISIAWSTKLASFLWPLKFKLLKGGVTRRLGLCGARWVLLAEAMAKFLGHTQSKGQDTSLFQNEALQNEPFAVHVTCTSVLFWRRRTLRHFVCAMICRRRAYKTRALWTSFKDHSDQQLCRSLLLPPLRLLLSRVSPHTVRSLLPQRQY